MFSIDCRHRNFQEFVKKITKNPIFVQIRQSEPMLDGIKNYNIDVEREEWKFDTLMDLYDTVNITQAIGKLNWTPLPSK